MGALSLTEAWSARALWLARLTIGWNVIEGVLAVGFGVAEESVALFGFGVDSWVEVGSAAVVYWKLTRPRGCAATQRRQERRAVRWISALFLLLSAGTSAGALAQLATDTHPDSTLPALIISLVSLSVMGALWQAKRAAAQALQSRTLELDAACSLACIQLSGVLLAGSAAYAAAPSLGWVDGAAALALAGLIAREGWSGWQASGRADFSGGCGCG